MYHTAADRLQLIPASAKRAAGVQFEAALQRAGATPSELLNVDFKARTTAHSSCTVRVIHSTGRRDMRTRPKHREQASWCFNLMVLVPEEFSRKKRLPDVAIWSLGMEYTLTEACTCRKAGGFVSGVLAI